jgi:hypothetical protein
MRSAERPAWHPRMQPCTTIHPAIDPADIATRQNGGTPSDKSSKIS